MKPYRIMQYTESVSFQSKHLCLHGNKDVQQRSVCRAFEHLQSSQGFVFLKQHLWKLTKMVLVEATE